MMNQKANREFQKKFRSIRFLILIIILAISTLFGILHQVFLTQPPVSVDALCPFGAIESTYTLIAAKTMLNKIATSSFLTNCDSLVAILFHQCLWSYLPFQHLKNFGRIGKKIFSQKIMPEQIDRFLRY